jgi:hypothetical protein
MSATSGTPVKERHILLVGPYGVLGTGVIDAVAEHPKWGITTAARRSPPTYRTQAAPPHVTSISCKAVQDSARLWNEREVILSQLAGA